MGHSFVAPLPTCAAGVMQNKHIQILIMLIKYMIKNVVVTNDQMISPCPYVFETGVVFLTGTTNIILIGFIGNCNHCMSTKIICTNC